MAGCAACSIAPQVGTCGVFCPVTFCPQTFYAWVMNRVGFTLQVQPEKLEAYKAYHQQVWPEMCVALSDAGWHNYSLFVRPDGLLFGYFETPGSLAEAQEKMGATEINARWQALMAPFFRLPEGSLADEMIGELEPIFYLP